MGRIKSERESGQMTFRALAEVYLATQTVRKHRTYPWKKATIEKRFLPAFGNLPINQINPLIIKQYREKSLGRFWVRRDDTQGRHDQQEFILY